MSEKHYNVWYTAYGRWTNYGGQDPNDPQPQTLKEAQEVCRYLNRHDPSGSFCVRELLSGGKPGETVNGNGEVPTATPEPMQATASPIATPAPVEPPKFDFDSYNRTVPGSRKNYHF